MKKLLIVILLLAMIMPATFAEDVEVTIPTFEVTLGDQVIDNEHNEFPLIVYKDITYFPMTWNFTRSLGLATDWNPEEGLEIGKTEEIEELVQDGSVVNDLTKSYQAQIADFKIGLNDQTLDNSQEEFPILLFRDVTYFPLTWRFAVEEFGWESDFDQDNGLSIVNTTITNNINIDNSVNNNTDVSSVNNSSVVINNNNIDNSVNDSNNTYNDYSSNITNNIDNSTNVQSTADKIEDILAEIKKLQDTGVTSGNLLVNYEVKDADTDEAIEGAVIYMNNMPAGVTDEEGLVELSVYEYAQYSVTIEHADYETISFIEGYNDAATVVKTLSNEEPKIVIGEKLVISETMVIGEQGSDRVNLEITELNYEALEPNSGYNFQDDGFVVNQLVHAMNDEFVFIVIDYDSPIDVDAIGMRYGADVDGLRVTIKDTAIIKEGNNLFVFRISKETINTARTVICLEIGDENSLGIDYKDLLD